MNRLAGTWRVFRAVLRNPALGRAQLAFFVYIAVEYATWIAFLIYGYDIAGPGAVGLVALVQLVPAAISAPLASTLADRYRRERVLQAAYLGQAVTMVLAGLGMLVGAPAAAVFVAAAAASVLMTISRPAQGSLLPDLARTPAELGAANGLMSSIEGIGSLVGPLAAAAILSVAAPGAVFVLSGAVVLGAAALLIRLPVPGAATRSHAGAAEEPVLAGTHREVLLGIHAVATHHDTRLVVILLALRTLATGCLDVLFVLLAMQVLGGGDSTVGLLNALVGFGSILGGAAAFALAGSARLTPALAGNALAFGIAVVLLGLGTPMVVAAILIIVAGFGSGGMDAAGLTILQRATLNAILARVLGTLAAIEITGLAAGSVLAPVLSEAVGLSATLVIVGLLVPMATVASLRGLRSIDRRVQVPVRELAVMRHTGIFEPLPPQQLEAVAARAQWLTAEAGDVLIREGDAGDRYYVLESGRLQVSRDGHPVVVLEGMGVDFGEIALLRDVPRTATVSAVSASVLLALDRADFLEALTGQAQARAVAEQHVVERLPRPR